MDKVSVVIPFFQREPGILARALHSIQSQSIPEGWTVEVIVVDDGSPCSVQDEVRDTTFTEPLQLKLLQQDNGGVASARNRALDEVDSATTLIAFLDSDDVWSPDHLARAITAHESGFDFYFTDNRRPGHHNSHVRSHCGPQTGEYIAAAQQQGGVLEIPTDYMVGLIVKEFPTQASTVVYRCNIAPYIRFDTRLKAAGEDVLFFAALVSTAKRVGFDLDSYVECGGGVNMYFANLSWGSPQFLAIKVDQLVAHRLISKTLTLSAGNKAWNDGHVVECRRALGFHLLRNLVKHPMRVPSAIVRLLRKDPLAALWLPTDLFHALGIVCSGPKRRMVQ
jgi:succinoglycan biosynthesis protein ExoW